MDEEIYPGVKEELCALVISKLTNALRPGGYLMIWAHESLPAENLLLQKIYSGVPTYQIADY